MATLFISHSSHDKPFARKLKSDLDSQGHICWLDETEIKVGDNIINKIQEGLAASDYIILILSKESVESKWVEKEWMSQFWTQVNKGRIKLLPLLIEECEIPQLLLGTKFADFSKDYDVALASLLLAISPSSSIDIQKIESAETPVNYSASFQTLLAKVTAGEKLSSCLAEGIAVAAATANITLGDFCKNELLGWGEKSRITAKDQEPDYRKIRVLFSAFTVKEFQNFTDADDAFNYLKNDKDFLENEIFLAESVPQLESFMETHRDRKGLMISSRKMNDFNTSAPADMPLIIYINPRNYSEVINRIRTRLISLLVSSLG